MVWPLSPAWQADMRLRPGGWPPQSAQTQWPAPWPCSDLGIDGLCLQMSCASCRVDTLLMSNSQIRGSIVVSISACHAEGPGSIPGRGVAARPVLELWAPSAAVVLQTVRRAPAKHRAAEWPGCRPPPGGPRLDAHGHRCICRPWFWRMPRVTAANIRQLVSAVV